jgi:tetratricopeptide (TPR) repeat protein
MLKPMICAFHIAANRGLIALLCLTLLALPVSAQVGSGKSSESQKIPKELLLPKEEPNGAADRKDILVDLYKRLKGSKDADSAGQVSAAIEKVWLLSGSATVDLLMKRVSILMNGKQLDTALQILNSIIEIAPGYSEGWNLRAVVYFAKKEFDNSLESLRHALALDPSHYKAIQGLGLLMKELGDKKAALKAFRHALSVHPHLEELRQTERELSREVEGQSI